MEEQKQNIISEAGKIFMRYGIKSVTMDDMARHMGVSKKTLYKFVSDKNELVYEVMKSHCDQEGVTIGGICERGLNAIDESFEISKFVVSKLKEIHPSIHFDLEKYHPQVWKDFKFIEGGQIYNCMVSNIEKGIKEGLYRDDLNIPVILKIYISRFDVVFDGEMFPKEEYNFADVYLEMFRYHIRGIASKKGIDYLIEKVKIEKQNL